MIGNSVNSFEMSRQYCQMNIACLAEIATVGYDAVEEKESNASVYPNPSNGTFNLNLGEGQWNVEVYDIMGRKVFANQCAGQSTLDLGQCPKGVYFLKATGESKEVTAKVVVQ